MKSNRLRPWCKAIVWLLAALAALAALLWGLRAISRGSSAAGLAAAQSALHRSVMQCYAIEGFYPPDVGYLKEHYGITYDPEKYIVDYEIIGSNLMPDVKVFARK